MSSDVLIVILIICFGGFDFRHLFVMNLLLMGFDFKNLSLGFSDLMAGGNLLLETFDFVTSLDVGVFDFLLVPTGPCRNADSIKVNVAAGDGIEF